MDTMLKELFSTSGSIETVTLIQVLVSTFLSFGLSLIIGYIYRVTHKGPSYTQSTVQTMIIMAVVISVIMLVIGSNIARAFSLVGALSIIRFRNAVKESRDVAFFFLTMAIGMACGTGFYGIAIIFTLCISVMIYIMFRFDVGSKPNFEILLKIDVDSTMDYKKCFNEIFYNYLESDHLLTVDSDNTDRLELVYTIKLRKNISEQALLNDLGAIKGVLNVQYINSNTLSI